MLHYPKLMISKRNKTLVVFMYKEGEGTVLQGDRFYKVGYSSTTWDINCFKDYKGNAFNLRYIFDGEKEIISIQNDNKPLKNRPRYIE